MVHFSEKKPPAYEGSAHVHQCRLHQRILRYPRRTRGRCGKPSRRILLHGVVHGHRAPRSRRLLVCAEALQRENLRRVQADGRNRAPHPRQSHAALPRRPRIPHDLLIRPASRRAHLAPARLRCTAPVRPRRRVPRRGRLPYRLLRVQRRRLVGHERESRDHELPARLGELQALFAEPCRQTLRAVRIVGRRIPRHIRNLRAPRRQPACSHLRLP